MAGREESDEGIQFKKKLAVEARLASTDGWE